MSQTQSFVQNLLGIYSELDPLVADNQLDAQFPQYHAIRSNLESIKANPDNNCRIMLFGVYNAGKSTLINALLGEAAAAMGDTPETAEVHSYNWKGFGINDTPGIDAPKYFKHQEITEDEIFRNDLVIYVISPTHGIEEQYFIERAADLFERGKRVFFVLNYKEAIKDESFIYYRDHIYQHLKRAGLEDLDQGDRYIFPVNAKIALRGRLENKPKLVELSRIETLESNLLSFVDKYRKTAFVSSTISPLSEFLRDSIAAFESSISDEEENKLEEGKSKLTASHQRLVRGFERELAMQSDILHDNLMSAMRIAMYDQDSDKLQAQIKELINLSSQAVQAALEEQNDLFQEQVGRLQADVFKNMDDIDSDLNALHRDKDFTANDSGISFSEPLLNAGAAWLSTGGLNSLGVLLTSLGLPTIARFVPIIGPVVGTLLTLVLGGSSSRQDDALARQLAAAQEREQARQRYLQHINDYSNELVRAFSSKCKEIVLPELEKQYQYRLNIFEQRSLTFNEEKQKRAQLLGKLRALKTRVDELVPD